ncbi:MAG: tetratricopeptide repeat protein [Treponema sp.]|jgi:tetratricopeptide (TPR) repeat protein|nr:tetratricopeptide repeat protein [Treponema sp.]
MTFVIVVSIFIATGIGFLLFFLVKAIALPKRVEGIEDLIKRGRAPTAVKAAKALIAKDPGNADARYMLGKAYLADKKDNLALAEFKVITESGNLGEHTPEEEFRRELARLFVRNKQGEEALKEYILLIKLNPQKAEYYYEAGKLFTARNRSDMAVNYLKKASELSPRDPAVHLELGTLLYKGKNLAEAKSALERSLKLKYSAEAYYYLGKIQKDGKDFQSAISTFEKAARDQSLRLRALLERGSCYMSLNAPEKAIPDLERALRCSTSESAQESLYVRYFLAMCYEKTRDMDSAIAQWDAIHSVKQGFRDVEAKLAQYQDLRNDDAIKDFLSGNQQGFMAVCTRLITFALSLQVKQSRSIPDGGEFVAIENDSEKWRNARKMPRLIRVYRSPDSVDDSKIRSILDDAKAQNMVRAAVVSSSGFTRSAVEYAESRSVELFNKDKLQLLLRQMQSG